MKQCIFCERPSDHSRYFNNQVIELCQDHYETRTLGEIAEQVRKHLEVIVDKQDEVIDDILMDGDTAKIYKKIVKQKTIEVPIIGEIKDKKIIYRSKLKADGYPFEKLKKGKKMKKEKSNWDKPPCKFSHTGNHSWRWRQTNNQDYPDGIYYCIYCLKENK